LFKGAALDLTEKVILLVLLFALSALIFRFYENPLRHSPSLKMNAAKTVTLGIGITLLSVVALMTARTFL
jgi:hypothetical protein